MLTVFVRSVNDAHNVSVSRCRSLVLLITLVLTAAVCPQGIKWEHTYIGGASRMASDEQGNLYVISIQTNVQGRLFPVLDKFSSTGKLLRHVEASYSAVRRYDQRIKIVSATSEEVRFLVMSHEDTSWSYLYRYRESTGEINGLASFSNMDVKDLAIGATTMVVLGIRDSDHTSVIQIRKQVPPFQITEVVVSHPWGQLKWLGGDEYVANGPEQVGLIPYTRLYRITRFQSVYYKYIPAASNYLYQMRLVVSRDGRYAWSVAQSAVGQYLETYVQAYDLLQDSFGLAWSVGPVSDLNFVSDAAPLGESGVAITGGNRGSGFDAGFVPTAQVFNRAGNNSNGGQSLLVADSFGDLIEIGLREYPGPFGLTLTRLHQEFGFTLHSAIVPTDEKCVPVDAQIDAAGSVRMLYREHKVEQDLWHVIQLDPAGVTIAPTTSIGGAEVIGTITLAMPAPLGGVLFSLSSSDSSASAPATVLVPEGASSAYFPIHTQPVASLTKATINATNRGLVVQSALTLIPPTILSITATPQSAYGGTTMKATVTLNGAAPAEGSVVHLTSSNPSKVWVQATTTVPSGSPSKSFFLTTYPTLANASAVITATTGSVSKTVFVAVLAPVLQSATLAAGSVQGGQSTSMTLTLGSNAPSGYTVNLLSGAQSIVPLPSSYTIPANTTTVTLPVPTNTVTTSVDITLVAYRGPYVKVMTLTVHP